MEYWLKKNKLYAHSASSFCDRNYAWYQKSFKEQLENLCWEFDKNGKLCKHNGKTEMKVAFYLNRRLIMDELKLAYLAGIKVGLESLVKGLKTVAGKNGNQLSIEFVEIVAGNTITDVELKLTSMENGKGLLDVLDKK